MSKASLILLICAILVFPVFPEDKSDRGGEEPESPPEISESSLFVEEVEVVGQVALNKAIQSVSVYLKEEMKIINSDGIKSFLNHCPGFLVLNGGHYGQFAYTFARGASVNQTLFLVEGARMTDPSSSIGLNTSLFSPGLFEKAEIVRGPLSNLYGSSAMGGVVNLITRREDGIEAAVFLGSHGTYEGNLYLGKKAGHFSFSLNGNLVRYSDGLENDEFNNRGLTARAGFQNRHIRTALFFFGHFSDSGIPFYLGAPTPNRSTSQDNIILVLPFTYLLEKNTKLQINLSHNRNRYDFNDPDDPWSPYYQNRSVVNEARLSLDTTLFDRLKIKAGVDTSHQRITNQDHTGFQLDGKKTNTLSAHLNTGLNLKKWLFSASVRYDKYGDITAELSPQFGFSYRISDRFKLRGSYSESFRAPTPPELFNPLWGNPDLEPEVGTSYEFGADLYLPSAALSVVYFNSRYRNLIGYSPVTWTFANVNEAAISGIEMGAKFELFDQVVVWAAYTYLDTHDFMNNQELIRRPRHALSAMIAYKNRYFTLSGEMIYVGKRLDYDEILWTTTEVPQFDTYNLNLNIPLNEKVTILGKATNALNQEYQEVLGYPAPGRRFLLGIRYKII